MIDAILAHPFVLLVFGWLASRLVIFGQVRTRLGGSFSASLYARRRWPQIAHSAFWTLVAYGLLVSLRDQVPIPMGVAAVLSAVAADQVIENMTRAMAPKARGNAPIGTQPSDITVIVTDLERAALEAQARAEREGGR